MAAKGVVGDLAEVAAHRSTAPGAGQNNRAAAQGALMSHCRQAAALSRACANTRRKVALSRSARRQASAPKN
jgi:hypothetical protein